ncbi:MAG: CapA family protein [Clostridiales bacterium]|nr:CapA family protein [Clostridiales bacterium]
MKKIWSVALVLLMLVTLNVLAVQAEEEEEVSLYEMLNPPTPTPDPNATPSPEPSPVPTATPLIQADGSVHVTITAVGDVTIGRNVQHSGTSIFEKELNKQDGDINFIFRNVKEIFEADDLTIANFEGVLADEYSIPSNKRENSYLFLAPTSYVEALSSNSVEAVTMENNHVGDFGDAGIASTIATMEKAGIVWSNKGNMGVYEVQGVKIAMLAYQTLNQPITSQELKHVVADDIAKAKETCDLVIVSFHWGNELDYSPRDNQVMLGRAAIDSGADLVLGHHSHRINPIECYKDKYIVYSLANCSFAGNNKPSDMFTFIFQTRFKIKDGEITDNSFRIIPCRISSRKDYNDFAITPLTEQSNITTVLDTMRKNSKSLDYAVESYPLEWD